jgi:beta-galactosidase
MRPKENGTRCDVARIAVSAEDKRSISIRDLSGSGFSFSTAHYTQTALNYATHIHTLKKKPLTMLNIDGAMCGVGGDLPGIAALHKAYVLEAGKTYSARLQVRF